MGSFSADEDSPFFDAQEDILSIADANSVDDGDKGVCVGFDYELWIRSPRSVGERRRKFMNSMGLSVDEIAHEILLDVEKEEIMDSVKDCCGSEEEFSSSRFSMSRCNSLNSSDEFGFVDNNNLTCQDDNLEKRVEDDGDEDSPKQLVVAKEYEDSVNVSMVPPYEGLLGRESEDTDGDVITRTMNRLRKGWFSRLRSMTCMVDSQVEGGEDGREEGRFGISGCRLQEVKVRQCRKKMKELSSLYLRQDIQAHKGSILTMKFSPDGQYLATGGEDGVVCVWQVVEEDRCNEIHIPEIDPSCVYFTVSDKSQLTPLFMDKEKLSKLKSMRKTLDSACVVFPPKIFRLLEKPLHEFRGHRSEVLDLSWSKKNVSKCYRLS